MDNLIEDEVHIWQCDDVYFDRQVSPKRSWPICRPNYIESVNKDENQLHATNSHLLVINYFSTCFGRLYAHHQEVGMRFTAYGFCPVVAVVMLESRVARCLHCAEGVAWQACFGRLYAHHQEVGMRFTAYVCLTGNILHTVHTSCHPTLQHHNSYNRTDNYRQWNSVRPLDDGHKDTRNMLRYYWLPINHYLLHLVGSSLYLVIKDSRLYEGKVCVVMLVGAWD